MRWSGVLVDTCLSPGQVVVPMRVGGATSQLDLSSPTPLSVAGCGRLQLGVPYWATSVDYCKCFSFSIVF